MRTTLMIDDDVLQAARQLARAQRRSVGAVLSELARAEITRPTPPAARSRRNGLPVLTSSRPVTRELVDDLLDAEGL